MEGHLDFELLAVKVQIYLTNSVLHDTGLFLDEVIKVFSKRYFKQFTKANSVKFLWLF